MPPIDTGFCLVAGNDNARDIDLAILGENERIMLQDDSGRPVKRLRRGNMESSSLLEKSRADVARGSRSSQEAPIDQQEWARQSTRTIARRCLWLASLGLKVAAIAGLFGFLGYGYYLASLHGNRNEDDGPPIVVERRVTPWRDVRRLVQRHGPEVFNDLAVFRKTWRNEYGNRPLVIETVTRYTKWAISKGLPPNPTALQARINIIDPDSESLEGKPETYLNAQFRILKLFMRSDYIDGPESGPGRRPHIGDLFVGVEH
jgi:hypothetical protein